MPASPNTKAAGHSTSTDVSPPPYIRQNNVRPAPSVGIRAGFGSWILIAMVLATALLLRLSIAATLPLVEPTEGRYAEISREMAESGDWVTPRLWLDGEDVPFLGKPPLFFWSAALSIRLFGANEFAVRLPSVVAATALLILMCGIVGHYLDRKTALSAAVITGASPLFFGASGTVILDLHLTFFVAGALLAYLAFALEHDPKTRRWWSLAVFVLLAGGFLTKGPVAIALFGLPVLSWTVLRRKWHLIGQHAWSLGIPLFILLVVPWFVFAELKNPGFLRYFFINENLLRYLSPDYGDLYGTGHRLHRGSAALLFLAAGIPWTPAAGWLLFKRRGAEIRKLFADDVSLFLFLGFAANVAFWCFARQLLATYLLPTIPLFAVWTAHTLVANRSRSMNFFKLAAGAALIWALLIVAIGPVAARDSTRSALAEGAEIARRNHVSGRTVFAGRTPYSAMFYSPGSVAMHPNTSVERTLNEAVKADEPSLVILDEADVDRVPESLRVQLQPMASDDHWMFLITPTP